MKKIIYIILSILIIFVVSGLGYLEYQYQNFLKTTEAFILNEPMSIEVSDPYLDVDIKAFANSVEQNYDWLKFEKIVSKQEQADVYLYNNPDGAETVVALEREQGFVLTDTFDTALEFKLVKLPPKDSESLIKTIHQIGIDNNPDFPRGSAPRAPLRKV